MTVSIIGLGLIGGSFAKALKERTDHRILGFDKSKRVMRAALESGAIDEVCTDFSESDIALIALYPAAAVKFIKDNANGFKKGSAVIDLCGVKRHILKSLSAVMPEDVNYIGGHPMAGLECSGFENSISTLFDGASMILTPDENILLEEIENISEFFNSIGFGQIEVTNAEDHDEIIAYTSQLAHIVSSAYIKNPAAKNYVGFSAGSFSDLTRVAKLNEDMWTELFILNSDNLQRHLRIIIDNLMDFHDVIAKKNKQELREMLREGREIKELLEHL